MRKHRHRIVRPTFLNQYKAFYLVDAFMDQVSSGEVIADANGTPIFQDPETGQWHPLAPEINGWCEAWARLIRRYQLKINLAPMLELARRLASDEQIGPDLIDQCQAIVNAARRTYRSMDMAVVWSIIQTTQVSIHLQTAGLINTADQAAQPQAIGA